ncbi:MAG: DNA repair protein RecO [Verrucomicrobiota bacterium]
MGNIENSEGVVVRILPYSESSLITTWITDRQGIVQILIRGIRKPKQKNFDPVDLLNQSSLVYTKNSRSHLHTAREIKCISTHRDVATQYSKLLVCSYFYEVISMLVERDTPINEIYSLYLKALDYLATHESSPELLERFERRLLSQLGLHHQNLSIHQVRQQHYSKTPKSWQPLQKSLKATT